jgi:predicted PhzF superfamily epimerase YddE/YHI9
MHNPKPPALPRDLEPAVNDLAGAASIAAAILSIVRTDHEAADSLAIKEGLGGLEVRLNAAAENLLAVQERRAPRWNTTMDADMIADALAAIPHGGEDAQ